MHVMSPLQVQRLQQLWRNTAAVRLHQRQLLFMQLQRFTERHAAKLVRTGAAFLSGATLTATSAGATRKGTSVHSFGCSALPAPPNPRPALPPITHSTKALLLAESYRCLRQCHCPVHQCGLCLSVSVPDLVDRPLQTWSGLMSGRTHRSRHASAVTPGHCYLCLIAFLLPYPWSTVKTNKL